MNSQVRVPKNCSTLKDIMQGMEFSRQKESVVCDADGKGFLISLTPQPPPMNGSYHHHLTAISHTKDHSAISSRCLLWYLADVLLVRRHTIRTKAGYQTDMVVLNQFYWPLTLACSVRQRTNSI
jgi:hypothetical protein